MDDVNISLNDINISCIICLELAISAFETKCCHAIICQECIVKLNICPNCRKKLSVPHVNIPISRMARQFDEKSKRTISDNDIMCAQATKYIQQIWNNIDQDLDLINIISLYGIVKVIGFERNQIEIIGKLLIKRTCKEITKTSIFNIQYNYSYEEREKGFPIAMQAMNDVISCFKNYDDIVKLHFDNHIDLLNTNLHQNIFNELSRSRSQLMNNTIYNNFVKMITHLLFGTNLSDDIGMLEEILLIIASISKTNKEQLRNFETNIDSWIRIKMKLLSDSSNSVYKLNGLLTKINNARNMSNMLWLQNIFTKYINDFQEANSIVISDQCNNDTINVFIGTRHIWNSTKRLKMANKIPLQLENQCDKIIKFSDSVKKPGHKLLWDFSLGSAEVEVAFNPKCVRTLICSTYQMMIVLLFNDHKLLTFKEILELTSISRDDIENHLLSLCHPVVHVIMKRPNCKTLLDTDKFILNYKYDNVDNPRKIPMLEPIPMPKKRNSSIYFIESRIVCLSMSRHKIPYNIMISEILSKISDVDVSIVKQCINNLVAQKYMEIITENNIKYVKYVP